MAADLPNGKHSQCGAHGLRGGLCIPVSAPGESSVPAGNQASRDPGGDAADHAYRGIPDFESEDIYLKGTFSIKGKVRLIHVLLVALRVFFDKEVRLVLAKVRK